MLKDQTKEDLLKLERNTRPRADSYVAMPPYTKEVVEEQVPKGWRPTLESGTVGPVHG
jgi:hypothetical protein